MKLIDKLGHGFTAAAADFATFVKSIVAPRARESVSTWCETNLTLPSGAGFKFPGRVSFRRRGWMRRIIDQASDPTCRVVIVRGPTRIGKTFILLMITAWALGRACVQTMWVDATTNLAKRASDREIQPLIRANPVLRDKVAPGRHALTRLWMTFRGYVLCMIGSNSASALAGFSCTILCGNEGGKWADAGANEADALSLSLSRTKDAGGQGKNIFTSTPTNEDDQGFTGGFMSGTQEHWHIGCKACSALNPLEFSRKTVVWDQDARNAETNEWIVKRCMDSARYVCVSCGHKHTQAELDELKEAVEYGGTGRWVAHVPEDQVKEPGWRTFQCDGLLGVSDESTMAVLVREFITATQSGWYGKIRNFWNSVIGKPYVDNLIALELASILHLQKPYYQGSLPDGWQPDIVILSHDVQDNRLPWVARGWKWTGESYLLNHGEAGDFDDLLAIQKQCRANYVIGDSNYELRVAQQLRAYSGRQHIGWILAEAFETTERHLQMQLRDPAKGTVDEGKVPKVPKLIIGDYDIKMEIEKRLDGTIHGWNCYSPVDSDTESRLALEKYMSQLLGQSRERRKKWKPGLLPFEFRTKGDDHFFDCEVYNMSLFQHLQSRRAADMAKRAAVKQATKVPSSGVVGKIG